MLDALGYLARHQYADGSWGRRLRSCRCPADPVGAPPCPRPVDAETRRRVDRLISQLGAEEIGVREAATAELRRIGEDAAVPLSAAAKEQDVEIAWRCRDLLVRLEESRGRESLELTGLALLSFLGAGYSYLSKDTLDGICYGDVVRMGLVHLLKRQKEDGSFGAVSPRGGALAAAALSEVYGLTGSTLFKEQAVAAVRHVMKMKTDDPAALFWKGFVLTSARVSEIPGVPDSAFPAVARSLKRTGGMLGRYGSELIGFWGTGRIGDLPGGPDPSSVDPLDLLVAVLTVRRAHGLASDHWKEWGKRVKEYAVGSLATSGCGRGGVTSETLKDRLERTAHHTLVLQLYWRYGGVLASEGQCPLTSIPR